MQLARYWQAYPRSHGTGSTRLAPSEPFVLKGAVGFVTLFLGGWHAPLPWLRFIPSYVWFFAKLSVLLFVFIWIRGTLPRTRVDQVMNFAWKFMLPMAFTCVVAAAVWHYQGRGLAGSILSDLPC